MLIEGRKLPGVEGEGVGGAVAVAYWLPKAKEGAWENVGTLAVEMECSMKPRPARQQLCY